MYLASCGEKSIEKKAGPETEVIDSTKSQIINVSGELFSIPSPIQTALLIKNSENTYYEEILSDPTLSKEYPTAIKKAMNLGIYGTDMAYTSLYDDGQMALRYFKAIENTAQELDITSAINPKLVKRLGANADNPDSLMYLSGKFYEEADIYLKKNDRVDIASLILLGGWIEGNYLTAKAAAGENVAAKKRLSEQGQSCEVLLEVLDKTMDENFLDGDIYKNLDSLNQTFSEIVHTYSYTKPETIVEEKRTIIRSSSEYDASQEVMDRLVYLLDQTRQKITEL